MKHLSMASVLLVSTLLAACGGNGSTSAGPGPITPPGPNSPTSPTSPVSPNSVLQTATIKGQQDFITSAGLAVYTDAGDSMNQSVCTAAGACLSVWPIVAPPAGVMLTPPFGSFVRPDNQQTQLTYNGLPLYTFASDTVQNNATGDNFQNFHLLHPAATTPTSAPQPQPSQAPATMAPVSQPTNPPGPIY